MEVKTFTHTNPKILDEQINEFLETKQNGLKNMPFKVIDIKYSTSPIDNYTAHSAMVIY